MINKTAESALYLGRCLAVAIMLGLTLLLGGTIGVGAAIQYGAIVPPNLEAQINGLHIVAFMTYVPECPPYTLCPIPKGKYYGVWNIYEPMTPGHSYGQIARRLLILPVKR